VRRWTDVWEWQCQLRPERASPVCLVSAAVVSLSSLRFPLQCGVRWTLGAVLLFLVSRSSPMAWADDQHRRPVPLDDAWQVESYRAGEHSGLGTLGITNVRVSGDSLDIRTDLAPVDRNRQVGEVFREIDDLGLGVYVDLVEATLTAEIRIPPELRTTVEHPQGIGAQLYVESESADGVKARQYGYWQDLAAAVQQISLGPTVFSTLGYTDRPDFDPERITSVGLQTS
jgi:hypothetical protein